MSQPSAATKTGAPVLPLEGGWLFIARVGWVALTVLILVLSAIALPKADALLQSVCAPGAPCYDIQLAPSDLRLLHQLGLSPGFLAAYQVGWDVATVLIYSMLAALLFWRRSSDRMALFCAYALVLYGGTTYTSLFDDGLRPLAPGWYWPVGVLELLGQVSLLAFFLLFPRGQFVPRWTRWGVLVMVLAEAHYIFFNDPLQTAKSDNPTDFLTFVALLLGLIILQIYRYRRVSTFRERQQTKWAVFGISVAFLGFIVGFMLLHLFPDATVQSPVFQTLAVNTLSDLFLLLIPISIAIAILRSQLYDIDTIINKALVYGLLTGILGTLYAGLIIGLASLAGAVNNPLALVIATLAIAALFQPLRRRIQSVIDRRFYRRKYDAEKTLAAFSATLRNEVDLNQLRAHVLAVVNETMQPEQASLWLAQPKRHPAEQPHRLEA